ncbi:MAG: M14-type cytosolic carboxypeptidase [Pseudomonadota bacterium]
MHTIAATALFMLLACHPQLTEPDDSEAPQPDDSQPDDTGPVPLTLSADFDSGRVGSALIEGDHVRLTLNTVTMVNTLATYAYWTHFSLAGAADKSITLDIEGVDGNTFFGRHADDSRMVVSCDGTTWERLPAPTWRDEHGGTYSVTWAPACDTPRIATFFPFNYTEMLAWTDEVSRHPEATLEQAATSDQGREIRLLTITDPGSPASDKRHIFILGRQHSGETAGTWELVGLVEFLLSGEAEAQALLQGFVWHIVPMLNPDGVYLGYSRATSELRDPNADWDNEASVEVVQIRALVEDLRRGPGLDLVLDWHNQVNESRGHDFVYSPAGNTFFDVLSLWTSFDDQAASGASSCTFVDCSFRGWTMTNVLYDPMFVMEPCPHLSAWTIASLREQGMLTARAVGAWFQGQP